MQSGTSIRNGNGNGNGKRKIVIKKRRDLETESDAAVPSLSFRLIDFNIYDKNVEISTEEQHATATATATCYQGNQNKKMVIQIFGINE